MCEDNRDKSGTDTVILFWTRLNLLHSDISSVYSFTPVLVGFNRLGVN